MYGESSDFGLVQVLENRRREMPEVCYARNDMVNVGHRGLDIVDSAESLTPVRVK